MQKEKKKKTPKNNNLNSHPYCDKSLYKVISVSPYTWENTRFSWQLVYLVGKEPEFV